MAKIKPITKNEIKEIISGEVLSTDSNKALLKLIVKVAHKQCEIIEKINEVIENDKGKKRNTRTTKKK